MFSIGIGIGRSKSTGIKSIGKRWHLYTSVNNSDTISTVTSNSWNSTHKEATRVITEFQFEDR